MLMIWACNQEWLADTKGDCHLRQICIEAVNTAVPDRHSEDADAAMIFTRGGSESSEGREVAFGRAGAKPLGESREATALI